MWPLQMRNIFFHSAAHLILLFAIFSLDYTLCTWVNCALGHKAATRNRINTTSFFILNYISHKSFLQLDLETAMVGFFPFSNLFMKIYADGQFMWRKEAQSDYFVRIRRWC